MFKTVNEQTERQNHICPTFCDVANTELTGMDVYVADVSPDSVALIALIGIDQ